jgi:methionyl aminopeptidase
MVPAIEPVPIGGGGGGSRAAPDDGSRAACTEDTVAITEDGPRVLTAREEG